MVVRDYGNLLKTQSLRVALAVLEIAGLTPISVPAQNVDEVVSQAIAADERENKLLHQFAYHQVILSEKLDAHDQPEQTTEIEMIVHPGEDTGFTVVTGRRGGTVVPTAKMEKLEKEAHESESFKANFTLRRLAPRFDKQLLGTETIRGINTYVIGFQPKPDQPFQERIEKILNRLQGKIWVSTEDYRIVQTEATLTNPVSLAWILATMQKLNFYYESQSMPGGWAPAKFNLSFQVEVMFREIRERQCITMNHFVRH